MHARAPPRPSCTKRSAFRLGNPTHRHRRRHRLPSSLASPGPTSPNCAPSLCTRPREHHGEVAGLQTKAYGHGVRVSCRWRTANCSHRRTEGSIDRLVGPFGRPCLASRLVWPPSFLQAAPVSQQPSQTTTTLLIVRRRASGSSSRARRTRWMCCVVCDCAGLESRRRDGQTRPTLSRSIC